LKQPQGSSVLASDVQFPLTKALRKAAARKGMFMLYYALMFFIVALIAGVLGFGGVAIAAAGIAKILFFVFLILFLVSLVGHAFRRT
jgi:uncharacterized membrane protein YtjA (UPF0391 family)